MSGQPLVIWGMDLLEQGDNWETEGSTGAVQQEDWEQLFAPSTVFLEDEFASQLGLHHGETLSVTVKENVHELVVGRVVKSFGFHGGIQQQVLMDIASAQWLFGWLGQVHHVAIIPEAGVATASLIHELQSLLPETLQVSQSSWRNRQVESMLRAFQMNLTMLSGISLLVGIFLVYNTTAFSVVHHRQEIGILRSLGMERHIYYQAVSTLKLVCWVLSEVL